MHTSDRCPNYANSSRLEYLRSINLVRWQQICIYIIIIWTNPNIGNWDRSPCDQMILYRFFTCQFHTSAVSNVITIFPINALEYSSVGSTAVTVISNILTCYSCVAWCPAILRWLGEINQNGGEICYVHSNILNVVIWTLFSQISKRKTFWRWRNLFEIKSI